MSRYLLKGNRPGFDLQGLERHDLPPNTGGHHYTEFRTKSGAVQAVVSTPLLSK